MKLLLISLLLSISLFAEATFEQVQAMINKQEYKQAKLALTVIAANHPRSAKVQYTLAQANAGLGDLPAAREAFDSATAIDPSLSFAPAATVASLREALTPPTAKIKAIESSNSYLYIFLAILSAGLAYWYFRKPKPAPVVETPTRKYEPTPKPYSSSYQSTTKYTPPSRPTSSTYSKPTPSKPTEVHHHHHTQSSDSTLSTIAVAGVTAAAVASLMDDDEPSRQSYSYEPAPSVSSSWEDTSSTSSSWEEPTTRSSSWGSSSSSSSDSWSSSSDSSSSSSWD